MASFTVKLSAPILLASLMLVSACGGGGSDNGENLTGGGGFQPPPTGTTSAPRYQAVAPVGTRAELLAQLNAEGPQGFGLLGLLAFPGDGAAATKNFYAKDGSATYTYEILDTPTTSDDLVTQANAQGNRGFRYLGALQPFGTLYRKSSTPAAYAYEALPVKSTVDTFVQQANAEGARGFWYANDLVFGTTTVSLFMKDSASNSQYTYEVLADNGTADAFVTQANAQGTRGFRYKGPFAFQSTIKSLYVKDTTQSARFTYETLALPSKSDSLVSQANNEGDAGLKFLGLASFGGSANITALYFKPASCTGFLCTSLNPLTQN